MRKTTKLLLTSALAATSHQAFAQSAGSGSGGVAAQSASPQAVAPRQSDATQEASSGVQDIIVTANKRAQSAKDVGLSISVIGGDELSRRQIDNPYDVAKLVPGLSVSRVGTSATSTYTLRGIGFNSASLGASPTVAVYVDEVPLPYPAMTQGAVLDLERLEVYKGPQGTLFGQNSTAGAVNFIAAKPTDELKAGIEASFGRFDWWNVNGFVSGPITDGIKIRIAGSHDGGGPWQKSYTRDATLGRPDRSSGRILVDIDPAPSVRLVLGLNGWIDKSDSQALQLVAVEPRVPANVLPVIVNYPLAPQNARAADWDISGQVRPGVTPTGDLRYNTKFWQPSLRAEYDVAHDITLTSLTTYSHYKTNSNIDNDGTIYQLNSETYYGTIKAFSQELRLSGKENRLHWTLGGNFSKDSVVNGLQQYTYDESNAQDIAGFSIGVAPVLIHQKTRSEAVFGNAEFQITDTLSLIGGARYTDTKIDFHGCNLGQGYAPRPDTPTPGVTQDIEGLFNFLYQAFSGKTGNPVQRGGCVTLDGISRGGQPPTFLPTDSPQTLDQHNVSWNVTLNYKPSSNVLIYGLVSQGYKSGSFPIFGASTSVQYLPARQESLRAYEAGFKLTLLDRTLQLNGAGFYYDYTDKQLSGYIADPVFGALESLVNVPKSNVSGAEIDANWVPVRGLNVTVGGTYVASKIEKFVGITSTGTSQNFAGDPFNLSPKWFANANAVYSHPISSSLNAFFGAGLTYRSKTTATIGGEDPAFNIRAFTLIDMQLGIEQPDKGWQLKIWGKNITNTYYWNNVNQTSDTVTRVAGLPATYGVTVGYKF